VLKIAGTEASAEGEKAEAKEGKPQGEEDGFTNGRAANVQIVLCIFIARY
jgi:hypothetical protein